MRSIWHAEIERACAAYRQEAEQRRRLSKHDPAADALEYVAADLTQRARILSDPTALLTVEEYAGEQGVSAQTVRNWIRTGQLEARAEGRGWRIASGTTRRKGGRRAAA